MKSDRPFKTGDMGWDMGDAILIRSRRKTRFGYVYVVQISDPKGRSQFLQAFMHNYLKREGIIGPDCNGEMPNRKLFKENVK